MRRLSKAIILAVCILFSFSATTAYAADYTVTTNDSLYKIGQLFKTPVDTIKQGNNLASNSIYPGQVLYVPAKIHTVVSGDTMYKISLQYRVPLSSLQKANNKWDNYLLPGQKLMIPGVKPTDGSGTIIPYTNSEVDLLARLIEAEAQGEIYEAKVAVGGVVVNRVQSTDWPNTITKVINQVINGYYQFTPVKNGMIQNPASDDSKKAAWAALYGSDPSNGAMFYFDDSTTNQWMLSKPRTANIDSMVFVK